MADRYTARHGRGDAMRACGGFCRSTDHVRAAGYSGRAARSAGMLRAPRCRDDRVWPARCRLSGVLRCFGANASASFPRNSAHACPGVRSLRWGLYAERLGQLSGVAARPLSEQRQSGSVGRSFGNALAMARTDPRVQAERPDRAGVKSAWREPGLKRGLPREAVQFQRALPNLDLLDPLARASETVRCRPRAGLYIWGVIILSDRVWPEHEPAARE